MLKRERSPDRPDYHHSSKQQIVSGDPISGYSQQSYTVPDGTNIAESDTADNISTLCHCHVTECNQSFSSMLDYEEHYRSCHRFVCRYCQRFYPTNHLLEIHLLETHDSFFSLLARKQPVFQCLVETCAERFMNPESRREHLVCCHGYPENFQFDRRQNRRAVDQVGGLEESRDVVTRAYRQTLEATGKHCTQLVPDSITFGIGGSELFKAPGMVRHHQTSTHRSSYAEDSMDAT